MMTIVTRVRLQAGSTDRWDRTMHARVEAARDADGWVSAQLLRGVDDPLERAIIGVWESQQAWQSWHDDPLFAETREQLNGLEDRTQESVWLEVVEDLG